MNQYEKIVRHLASKHQVWLITGVAGFIGSNLLETLLQLDQRVVGLDNFSTGHRRNLDDVKSLVGSQKWRRFSFIEGDIADAATCASAVKGVDHVLHQAALGSVPRSIENPIATHVANIDGFVNMLDAARQEGVTSFTYAASSAVYGDSNELPKVESLIGRPLSPYAVTKYVNELYAEIYQTSYGFKSTGLRYFNVFGPRQDPTGAYAAVIPKWIGAMLQGKQISINGDGETSRDFCYIDNVVQANLLAALASAEVRGGVYNIAVGERTSLNQLASLIETHVVRLVGVRQPDPKYVAFRQGDVAHSLASISRATAHLDYCPQVKVDEGLKRTIRWYADRS